MTPELKLDGTPVEPPIRWEETIRRFEAEDALHMSHEGYLLWARLLRPLLAV